MPEAPDECANCGARIPRGAKACPECGADERTGWRETSVYDSVDLPDSAYDDEPGENRGRARRVNGIAWHWWLAAIILLVLLVTGALRLL